MRQQSTAKQGGFTLVEISLAMAIFTFMLLVVALAYINIARLYNAATAARNVQQNNRFVMEQITRVAHTASVVAVTDRSLCFGNQAFVLVADATDAAKTSLHQVSVKDCNNIGEVTNDRTLTSPGVYVAKWQADTSVDDMLTISVWMASRVDLLQTTDNGLQCRQTSGKEFCAVNKLTTTVQLRGNK